MTGFGLDAEELRRMSDKANALAEDLRALRSGWDGTTAEGGRSFATRECGEAFGSFQQVLFDQLHKRITAFEQTSTHIRDSATTYENSDQAGNRQFGGLL